MTIRALRAPALLACGWAASALAQAPKIPSVVYPALPRTAADPAGFVPRGWAIIASRRGDLNGDGAADLALLLKMRDRANILLVPNGRDTERFDTNPHLLLVAFAERRGLYRLAASSHGLFLRPSRPWTGDEPPDADTIALERGDLVVTFFYLRGTAKYRFRWRKGAFRLIGYDSSDATGGCLRRASINYLTGRARVASDPISSDRERAVWRRLRNAAPPTLDRIDLEDFSPEMAIAGLPPGCSQAGDE